MPDWNDPGVVAAFAGRPPDHRLVRLVEEGRLVPPARALDVGCAGGRNAAFMDERGIEVHAVDASPAMVRATRERLSSSTTNGTRADEAHLGSLRQVVRGPFDLIVALGVLQHAPTDEAFDAAVAEIAALVAPWGAVMVAHFTPASRPYGRALDRVPGTRHVYAGWDGPHHRMCLHDAADLDAAFARHGLVPTEPSTVVERPHDEGLGGGPAGVHGTHGTRVTCNASYRPADVA